jgi:sugar lactone lactonase YvrE
LVGCRLNSAAEIDVPERPIDWVFGGAGGRTLFILAPQALFAAAEQTP